MTTNYKKLNIWKRAFDLTLDVYGITKSFPDDEKSNIIWQMRRAATSIPTNIAEGASSRFDRNFVSQLSVAYASGKELENLLLLSKDLGYIDLGIFNRIFRELDRLNSQIFILMDKLEYRLNAKKRCSVLNDIPKNIKYDGKMIFGMKSSLNAPTPD